MQMGADCLKYDRMSKMDLSNNAMAYIIKIMKSLAEKIIIMGGGGYNPWVTLRAWTYNLATLMGEENNLKLTKEAKYFLNNINLVVHLNLIGLIISKMSPIFLNMLKGCLIYFLSYIYNIYFDIDYKSDYLK